jgi:Domain of unknown function (DUF1998)
MAGQRVRPSQFVTTYGPGAVLETPSGPVVVRSMDSLFQALGTDIQRFEIIDERLSRAELGGSGIVRMPANAELNIPEDDAIYQTERFPLWSLCVQHQGPDILYPAQIGCPICRTPDATERIAKAGREAIRFVLACSDGHLDDVDWNYILHPTNRGCRPTHYLWFGGGGTLRNMRIQCTACNAPPVDFGSAYHRDWLCSGRLPELGVRPAQSTCAQSARIIQRGASNLRQAVTVSALTILDIPNRLHNVLQDREVLGVLRTLRALGRLDEPSFRAAIDGGGLPEPSRDVLRSTPWDDLDVAIQQLLGQNASTRPLKLDEFDRLRQAAHTGAPPTPPENPLSPPLFEVIRDDVRVFAGIDNRLRIRVTPVNRLRIVLAQTGYQRVDTVGGRIQSVDFQVGARRYLPGVELFGEGIFLDLDGADLALQGARTTHWLIEQQNAQGPLEKHPVHVWWHTLSHRLLRSLSVDSGYSSAAIRERVYVEQTTTGTVHGGVLLYTVQPGGDGTLGGLIALVPAFDRVLEAALSDVGTCSNDPLCEENIPSGVNGAACYSCLLTSETSCEYRNSHLDRVLLSENLP